MDFYKSLRVIALRDVLSDTPSNSYAIRRIMRWYSKTFHTPLDKVDDLPLVDILQHYYEVHYEDLPDIDRDDEVKELSMTDKERVAKQLQDDRDEMETFLLAREAEQENAAAERRAATKAQTDATEKAKMRAEDRKALAKILGEEPGPVRRVRSEETALPAMTQEKSFSMSFVDLEELDRLSESDGLDIEPLVGLK